VWGLVATLELIVVLWIVDEDEDNVGRVL